MVPKIALTRAVMTEWAKKHARIQKIFFVIPKKGKKRNRKGAVIDADNSMNIGILTFLLDRLRTVSHRAFWKSIQNRQVHMKFLDKSAQTLNNKMHVRVEVLRDFDSIRNDKLPS